MLLRYASVLATYLSRTCAQLHVIGLRGLRANQELSDNTTLVAACYAGKRMTVHEWADCPCCHFPCRLAAFKQVIQAQQHCPMCNQAVSLDSIKLVKDPLGKPT